MSVRMVWLRKEGSHYKDCNKTALLVLAYDVRAECYTKDSGNRKRNQDPSQTPFFRARHFVISRNAEKNWLGKAQKLKE
jgi:hypothetical protein